MDITDEDRGYGAHRRTDGHKWVTDRHSKSGGFCLLSSLSYCKMKPKNSPKNKQGHKGLL